MSSKTTPLGRPRGTLGARRGDLRRRLLVHHLPLAVVSALVLFLFMSLPAFLNSSSAGDVSSGPFPKSQAQGTQGMTHGGGQPMTHGDSQGQPMNMPMPGGPGPTKATRNFLEQLSISTGYLALGFVGLTLLIGSLNLLLRRRSPVSSYLRRDIGIWAAVAIVAHVILGVRSMGINFYYFFINDGRPRVNSFGWGNWTGLVALVIVVGLLTISTTVVSRS